MPTAPFGATGHHSSRVIFGAAALGAMRPERAQQTLDLVLAHGVNHIDTAASYGDSELRLAPWLATHRADVFLATKTGERNGDAARAQLERSLERLGTDRVDLIQLHNLVEEDEWRTAFSTGGAVEALFAASSEGLCRHVGITGHGLRIARMHLRSLAEAPFASVLLPWSHTLAQIDDYAADAELVFESCTERGVAVQTIKSIARRRWRDDDPTTSGQPKFAWYEPLDDDEAIERATRFVLADRRLFLNTSSDARRLEATLRAGADPAPTAPRDDALRSDRDRLGMEALFDGGDLEVI